MKLTKQYQELARLAQAYLTSGSGVHRTALEAAVQKALSKEKPDVSIPKHHIPEGFTVIRFDGGTPCNIPKKGYGIGYGSYQIDDGPIIKVNHGIPCSNNVAEILTLHRALTSLFYLSDQKVEDRRVFIIGDSQIALDRVKSLPRSLKKKYHPTTDYERASLEMNIICQCFKLILTQWQPRAKSVAVFGH